MPASMKGGGASNPNQRPAGGKGSAIATTNAINDDAVRAGFGKSRHGRPLERMMKMTRIWVAIDSRNHAVWYSAGVALNTSNKEAKVRKSNRDDIGPMIAAKRISPRMSQTCGRAVASGRTPSNGIPISERS